MNWYKKAKDGYFPFSLDELWDKILSLKIDTNPPLPKSIGKINDIGIILVDGDIIKKKYFMDFVEGGNDMAYDFVTKNQIWIDDNMSPKVIPHIIYHEFLERFLMKNKGMKYDEAHDIANRYEKKRI